MFSVVYLSVCSIASSYPISNLMKSFSGVSYTLLVMFKMSGLMFKYRVRFRSKYPIPLFIITIQISQYHNKAASVTYNINLTSLFCLFFSIRIFRQFILLSLDFLVICIFFFAHFQIHLSPVSGNHFINTRSRLPLKLAAPL